jgi:glucose/arabinose dehydrogenase
MLKASRLLIVAIDSQARVTDTAVTITNQGRLRSAVQGPDGNLYLTTDNGNGTDKILKVVPG